MRRPEHLAIVAPARDTGQTASMSSDVLSAVGLLINLAGVVVAFFFGFPQPLPPKNYMVWAPPAPEELTVAKRRRRVSLVGLALLGIGFLVQFAALVID